MPFFALGCVELPVYRYAVFDGPDGREGLFEGPFATGEHLSERLEPLFGCDGDDRLASEREIVVEKADLRCDHVRCECCEARGPDGLLATQSPFEATTPLRKCKYGRLP